MSYVIIRLMRNLLILAGGKSSRMGQDKVMLELDGMPFIEHIYRNAKSYFDRIIISTDTKEHANRIRQVRLIAQEDPEIVTDAYMQAGPIGGICTAFEKTSATRFSVISADVPFADMRVLAALFDACKNKAALLKIGEKKPEPLIAAYDRTGYPDLKSSLDKGNLKLRLVFDEKDTDVIDACEIPIGDGHVTEGECLAAFMNINTQDDYHKAREAASTDNQKHLQSRI